MAICAQKRVRRSDIQRRYEKQDVKNVMTMFAFGDVVVDTVIDIGNGSFDRGVGVLCMLSERLRYARSKHNWRGENTKYAAEAVWGEAGELHKAVIDKEGPTRELDEALDTAVTAIRFINKEWEEKVNG